MSQRHTFLFGTVLAVAGAAVAADHYLTDSKKAVSAAIESTTPAPVAAPQPAGQDEIIELAPCSASMDGLMAAPPSQPKAAPAPVPAAKPATPQTAEGGIIEFAPCSAGMGGLMATPPVQPKPAPKPVPKPVAPAAPVAEDGIIEFAPCAAGF